MYALGMCEIMHRRPFRSKECDQLGQPCQCLLFHRLPFMDYGIMHLRCRP